MLRFAYLMVLLTTIAAEVLTYVERSNVNSRNVASDMLSNLEKFAQEQKSSSHDKNTYSDLDTVSKIKCDVNGTIANCTNRGIHSIEQLLFSPPIAADNITGLNLSQNSIEFIEDKALANFIHLEWLDISYNDLQCLNNDSFYNLSVLTKLHLQGNNLSLSNETFPLNVFKPLMNLTELWIQKNRHVHGHELDYPDKAFAYLKSLTTLHMDGLPNKTLGSGFNNMSSLTHLILRGHFPTQKKREKVDHCNLISLNGDMFTNVPGLTHLALINCKINGKLVDPQVFVPLQKLEFLDLSHNDNLKLEHWYEALANITNSHFKILNITNIINPYSPGVCVPTEFCKSLPRTLEELYATSNSFESFENGSLEVLPSSLKQVDVGSNKFTFWTYLEYLNVMENLENLTIGKNDAYPFPWYYPPDAQSYPGNECTSYGSKSLKLLSSKPILTQPLPPKLKTIDARNAGFSNHFTEIHFNESNILDTLLLDLNNIPSLEGPVYGLNKLQTLSLTHCRIKHISLSFFQNLTSLVFLNLSSNYFGDLAFRNDEAIFETLINLTILDLSFTDIKIFSNNTFKGLINLQELYLQLNPFKQFEVNINFMQYLQRINLSTTNLGRLNSTTTLALDKIHGYSHNLTVDISGNTIFCVCHNLGFLKWMTKTKVLPKKLDITCQFKDQTNKHVNTIKDLYDSLQKQCASNLPLFSIVISATFLLLFVIVGVILYHFRWRLWYLYHSLILQYKSQVNMDIDQHFEYDVFVSYANEDHDFVVNTLYPQLCSHGLNVHIHGLHFVAGEFISRNIVNAVRSSRRTLVVLTPHLQKSKWSKYEVEIANMEQVHTGRSVLLFLIMDKTTTLTPKVLYHIKNNTYIEFPSAKDNPREVELFWTRLVSGLTS